jgi:7-cyano-7-deazaguanine synthase
MKDKAVLLIGGGIDSVAVFFWLLKNNIDFMCVYVDYAQVASNSEYASITKLCRRYSIHFVRKIDNYLRPVNKPNMLFGDDTDNVNIDGRNLMMVLAGLPYGNTFYMGNTDWKPTDEFSDVSPEWLINTGKMLSTNFNRNISITSPYILKTKLEMCLEAIDYDKDFFELTMTCWIPTGGKECGKCKHCLLKQKLIGQCNYKDEQPLNGA